eukprot:134693-Amphidinium_carterae.1
MPWSSRRLQGFTLSRVEKSLMCNASHLERDSCLWWMTDGGAGHPLIRSWAATTLLHLDAGLFERPACAGGVRALSCMSALVGSMRLSLAWTWYRAS